MKSPMTLEKAGVMLFLVALVAALGVLPAGKASADNTTLSTGKGPVVQSVTGSGHFTPADGALRTFSFNARRYADGSVDGHWERVNHTGPSPTTGNGKVTCFTIRPGNDVRLGGFSTSGAASAPPTNGVVWRVIDNGEGASSPLDQISVQLALLTLAPDPPQVAAYCAGGLLADDVLILMNNVECAGNIRVRP